MNEMLDMAEESDDECIIIEPSDTHKLTDENSADSEDKNTHVPSALSGRQLIASAELQRNDDISDDEDFPLAQIQKIVQKLIGKKQHWLNLAFHYFPKET